MISKFFSLAGLFGYGRNSSIGMRAYWKKQIRLCLLFSTKTTNFARKFLQEKLEQIVLFPEQNRMCRYNEINTPKTDIN